MKHWLKLIIALLGCCVTIPSVYAQCMYYPVSLSERVQNAEYIVLGKVTGRETYPDPVTGNIQTLNKLEITAWLKNQQATREVYIITQGGVYQNRATRVWPALQLEDANEYVLFLDKETFQADNKAVRSQRPNALQVMAYADAQGALPLQDGLYTDLLAERPMDEATLFGRIQLLTQQTIVTPGLQRFEARRYVAPTSGARVEVVTTFSPTTTHAGTIATGDFVTISGSGFGTTKGTVSFKNADDGGNSYITPKSTSDYVTWTDNSITVKVPDNAGTGDFRVNNTMNSNGILTITYAHYSSTDDFQGFPTDTRQRIYLRNLNDKGGYNFLFSTTFNSNTNAVAAFERALATWRCATGVNFRSAGSTPITSNLNDGVNVVLFDATLGAGTLAQTVANFSATANGSCTQANTVWWFSDMDIRVRPAPTSTHSWNFTSSAPTANQYDFESIALHELGHAHGLGHVIAQGQVMHYAIQNGAQIRVLSTHDIAGGTAKMAYSTASTCFNPTNSGTPMAAVPKSSCVGLDSGDVADAWSVSGSRTNSVLLVNGPTTGSIQVFSISGQLIYSGTLRAGTNTLVLGRPATGIYFCRFITPTATFTKKISVGLLR
jgi:hypothetical protein